MKKSTLTVYSCEYCGEYFGEDRLKCAKHEKECTCGVELRNMLNKYYRGKVAHANTVYFPYGIDNKALMCAMFRIGDKTVEYGMVPITNPGLELEEITKAEWDTAMIKASQILQHIAKYIHCGQNTNKKE